VNRMLARTLCLAICLAAASSQAEPAKGRPGRLAWIAIECAAYADMSGQSNEGHRLSDLGIENARASVDAYFSNQITMGEFASEIPLGAKDVLFGPSKDKNFIAGRLFQSATSYATERVIRRDADGMLCLQASSRPLLKISFAPQTARWSNSHVQPLQHYD
jgi:hypothetical protein